MYDCVHVCVYMFACSKSASSIKTVSTQPYYHLTKVRLGSNH